MVCGFKATVEIYWLSFSVFMSSWNSGDFYPLPDVILIINFSHFITVKERQMIAPGKSSMKTRKMYVQQMKY